MFFYVFKLNFLLNVSCYKLELRSTNIYLEMLDLPCR